jgi:hypothetical protein
MVRRTLDGRTTKCSGVVLAVAAALLLLVAAPAQADWSGDGAPDVVAIDGSERVQLFRGTGAGTFVLGGGLPIGTGWGAYDTVLAPGDFNGDGGPDLLVRRIDGRLLLYRGNGGGGFATGMGEPIGAGWQDFTALLAPGDFSGDGTPDLLARLPDGRLLLYRGNGTGGWLPGAPEVGSGWQPFTALLAPGDFSGDGKPDVIARQADGTLLLYRGNGSGGWLTGAAEPIGAGWQSFTALAAGDFSGDGKPDVIARHPDGRLVMYRGNGAGAWVTGTAEPIGSGWEPLRAITVADRWTPPPPPPAPPSAPLPDGRVKLDAGIRCTPPGGRLRVSLRVRPRPGRAAPRVLRVVFFARGGPRRVDKRKPYVARLPMQRPAGQRGRVYARVVYRRQGSKRVHRKTVSRRFAMCR